MFKDYILAIILGTLLGFGITGGYFSLKNGQKTPPTTNQPVIITPTSAPQQDSNPNQPETNFLIETPQNYSIVKTSKIDIIGSTTTNSVILFSTPIDNYVTQTDDSGNFSQKISLESGFNIIQISAVDPDDKKTDLELVVTYSTADI